MVPAMRLTMCRWHDWEIYHINLLDRFRFFVLFYNYYGIYNPITKQQINSGSLSPSSSVTTATCIGRLTDLSHHHYGW